MVKSIIQFINDTRYQMGCDYKNGLMKYNSQNVKHEADGNMTYGPLNGEMTTFVYDCRN